MKRFAIGLLVVSLLGAVGYTSYSLVSFAKSKADNEINSQQLESDKTVDTNDTETQEKEVENSKENSSESTLNNSSSTTSDSSRPATIPTNNDQFLDFSSADAFILSYNNLVSDVGSSVTKEDVFSEASKSWLVNATVGNLSIFSYQFDGLIKEIYIQGEDKVSDIEGLLNGKAKVKYENGNTIIYDFSHNN